MKVTVNKQAQSVVELLVDVPADVWSKAQSKAFTKLSKEVSIPGFRKGKAPTNLIKDKIDPQKQLQEAVNHVLDEAFQAALSEAGVMPIMQPSYDVTKISNAELQLKFVVVTMPTVELAPYKDLKIGHEEVTVSDEAIAEKLSAYQAQNAELTLKEGEAALGDTVVIDFEGFVDGVAFEGGKAENHELELGSGQFIPGFEEQLVGAKPGQKLEVNVTFPENYTAELKSKPALFKVTVHEIKAKVTPELTDEFAKTLNLPEVDNLAALRIHARAELLKQAEEAERTRYVDAILAKLRAETKFEIAEELIHQEGHQMQDNLAAQVKQQGLEWDQYLEMTGQTNEQLHDKFHEEARVNLQNFLVLNEIAKLEEIEASDADVDFEVSKMAEMYKMEEAKVREILGENLKNIKQDIRQRRIIDFLVEHNK